MSRSGASKRLPTKTKTTERDPIELVEPRLKLLESDKCTESVLRDACLLSHNKTPTRACFANFPSIGNESAPMRLPETKGLRAVNCIKVCDIFSISRAELKEKPINFILAATLDTPIVTDKWLLESAAQSQLLDHEYFLARNTFWPRGRMRYRPQRNDPSRQSRFQPFTVALALIPSDVPQFRPGGTSRAQRLSMELDLQFVMSTISGILFNNNITSIPPASMPFFSTLYPNISHSPNFFLAPAVRARVSSWEKGWPIPI